MDELKFRAIVTAVLKEAQKRHEHRMFGDKLTELDIDVIVSEAIRIAGKERIKDCPGPLAGFENAVEYAGDVVFEDKEKEDIGYQHVIEVMWGMPNWLCLTEQDCWDCFAEPYHELGNRVTTYLRQESERYIKIRIDGVYGIADKLDRSKKRVWSEKSIKDAMKKWN